MFVFVARMKQNSEIKEVHILFLRKILKALKYLNGCLEEGFNVKNLNLYKNDEEDVNV